MRKLLRVVLILLPILVVMYLAWIFSQPLRSKPLAEMQFDNTVIIGMSDLPITITLFTDLRCRACREYNSTTMSQIEDEFIKKGLARLRIQQYPFHPESAEIELIIRRAGNLAPEMTRRQLTDLAYSESGFKLSPKEFAKLVSEKSNGKITLPLLLSSLDDKDSLKRLLNLHELARSHGVFSTPAIAVNDILIENPRNLVQISDAINSLKINK